MPVVAEQLKAFLLGTCKRLFTMAIRKATGKHVERAKLLLAVKKDPSISVTKLALSVGVTRPTARKWKARIVQGCVGLEGAARSGRPCKQTRDELKAAKRHLVRSERATMMTTTALVNRHGADGDHVSVKTVQRHLAAQKCVALEFREPSRQQVSNSDAKKRREATTRAATKHARNRLRRLVFLDAAFIRWKPGPPLKRLGEQRNGWTRTNLGSKTWEATSCTCSIVP